MKVTLEERDTGETVVIEQRPDGHVTCERLGSEKPERAANTSPPAKKARGAETAEKRTARPAKGAEPREENTKARKAADKPKRSEEREAVKSRGRKPEAQRGRRGTSLEWSPVKDHDYDGFAAPSHAGQFKALKTKDSQWALFYELKGTWPKHIGCFGRKPEKAQARAQELHDAGWPETEFGPITAGQIARACPAPRDDDADDQKPKEKRGMRSKTRREEESKAAEQPTPEEKPEPRPAPEPVTKVEAEQDKELLGSFTTELDSVLDEDEDD